MNLKIFPSLSSSIGLSLTFILHGFVCLAACLVVFLFLPETKGLTLSEISNLNQKKTATKTGSGKKSSSTSSNSSSSSNATSFTEDVEEAFKMDDDDEEEEVSIPNILDEERRNLVLVWVLEKIKGNDSITR